MAVVLAFVFSLTLSGIAQAAPDSRSIKASSSILIALFPFENFSDNKEAVAEVMPHIRNWLEDSGFKIVPEPALDKFLLVHDIRCAGRLSGELISKAGQDFGAEYILLGSVNLFSSSDNPLLSISARLVSVPEGNLVWGKESSYCGQEFKGILGLGKITNLNRLFPIVVADLLSPLNKLKVPFKGEIRPFRVAVLPFDNFSSRKYVGMVATYALLSALPQKSGWEAVEYGTAWNILVSENYPYRGNLDYSTMQALGKTLGVDGVLLGTVEKYNDPPGESRNIVPEVSVSLRLLSVYDKAIVWADQITSTGADDLLVFDWGRVWTADKLTQNIIQKLVKRLPLADIRD